MISLLQDMKKHKFIVMIIACIICGYVAISLTGFLASNASDNDNVSDTWLWLLNAKIDIKKEFLKSVQIDKYKDNKVMLAKIQFIQNCVKKIKTVD